MFARGRIYSYRIKTATRVPFRRGNVTPLRVRDRFDPPRARVQRGQPTPLGVIDHPPIRRLCDASCVERVILERDWNGVSPPTYTVETNDGIIAGEPDISETIFRDGINGLILIARRRAP